MFSTSGFVRRRTSVVLSKSHYYDFVPRRNARLPRCFFADKHALICTRAYVSDVALANPPLSSTVTLLSALIPPIRVFVSYSFFPYRRSYSRSAGMLAKSPAISQQRASEFHADEWMSAEPPTLPNFSSQDRTSCKILDTIPGQQENVTRNVQRTDLY